MSQLEHLLRKLFEHDNGPEQEWHRAKLTSLSFRGMELVRSNIEGKPVAIGTELFVDVLSKQDGVIVNEEDKQAEFVSGLAVSIFGETGRLPVDVLDIGEEVKRFKCSFCYDVKFVSLDKFEEMKARPKTAGSQNCLGHDHHACDACWEFVSLTAGNTELDAIAREVNQHRAGCMPCRGMFTPPCAEMMRILERGDQIDLGNGHTLSTVTEALANRAATSGVTL